MTKNILILSLLVLPFITIKAQEKTDTQIKLKKDKFSVNLALNPSFNYEFKLAEKQTMKLAIGYAPIIDKNWKDIGATYFLSATYRRYYSNDNPKLSYNSGNYYGVKTKLILDEEDVNGSIFTPDKAVVVNAVWGFQNNYKNGLYFGVTLGSGIAIKEKFKIGFSALVDVQFGINL